MEVTKDFQAFVKTVEMTYHEVYDFYQAVSGNEDGQSTFSVRPANGDSDDILIIYKASDIALRLTPAAKGYLPKWIEQHLMDGLDAETYWGFEHAKEDDERDD